MADLNSIRLRPSSGPVAKNCASSMFLPPGALDITEGPSVFSATGTALHAVFKDYIYLGRDFKEADLVAYCDRYEVAMHGYFGILWRAYEIREKWVKVTSWYQGARREETIRCTLKNGFVLEGTPDLHNVFGTYAVIFDLKTGETDMDYFPQVELYALILWKLNGALGLQQVHAALFSPMLQKYVSRVFTAEYLAELEDQYIEAMEAAGIRYTPGPHCRWCKRLTECPAVLKAIDPVTSSLAAGQSIAPGDLAHMRPAIAVMERIVRAYKEMERVLVERFGTVDIGNGYELYIKTWMKSGYKPRETVAYLLREGISMEAILDRMEFNKEDIKQLAREIAIPRDKERGLGATQARLIRGLEESGATDEKAQSQLTQRLKPDSQIAQEE